MFCLSNCSKEGPCLSSPPVSLFLGKDPPLYRHAPSPRKHSGLRAGGRSFQPHRRLLLFLYPGVTPPLGSTPSAPQTVGFLEAETMSRVPAPRLALVLGARLGMKESVLPPQAAAPRATGQLSSLPWEGPRSLGSSQDCRRSWEPPPCQPGWSWIHNPLRIRTWWTPARRCPRWETRSPGGGLCKFFLELTSLPLGGSTC